MNDKKDNQISKQSITRFLLTIAFYVGSLAGLLTYISVCHKMGPIAASASSVSELSVSITNMCYCMGGLLLPLFLWFVGDLVARILGLPEAGCNTRYALMLLVVFHTMLAGVAISRHSGLVAELMSGGASGAEVHQEALLIGKEYYYLSVVGVAVLLYALYELLVYARYLYLMRASSP